MPESNIELAGNKNIKTSKVEKSVDTPADFTSPEVLYEDLIEKVKLYHPSSDLSDIERAYKVAKKAHEGQFRKVGPGAGGCLATGLIYSLYGKWGFFKFRWITLKYVINILFITYGMLVFLPFTHGQYSYYLSQPTEAIIPEESIWMNIFCTSQNFCTILMFLFVVYLSVFKSVKKKNRERPRPFTTD